MKQVGPKQSQGFFQSARDCKNLRWVASDIIEGHLMDSIASITPRQVMMDKDRTLWSQK